MHSRAGSVSDSSRRLCGSVAPGALVFHHSGRWRRTSARWFRRGAQHGWHQAELPPQRRRRTFTAGTCNGCMRSERHLLSGTPRTRVRFAVAPARLARLSGRRVRRDLRGWGRESGRSSGSRLGSSSARRPELVRARVPTSCPQRIRCRRVCSQTTCCQTADLRGACGRRRCHVTPRYAPARCIHLHSLHLLGRRAAILTLPARRLGGRPIRISRSGSFSRRATSRSFSRAPSRRDGSLPPGIPYALQPRRAARRQVSSSRRGHRTRVGATWLS